MALASTRRSSWLAVLAIMGLVSSVVMAADRPRKVGPAATASGESVDMFEAIRDGRIEVQLIPKDSTECNVVVKNKSDKPLSVRLPDVFAGVPLLAQGMGGMGGGMGGGRQGGGMGGGGSQGMMGGMGGGMGGMGGGMMGGGMGGMGGGFMNVPPEKVGQAKAPAVCLEHGKKEPRPNIPYKIVPIDQFTDKGAVQEIGRLLGNGAISQRAAQVATWHLQNNMSWEELAAKQTRFANGTSRPYFSPQEIQAGMQIATTAANLAERRKAEEKNPPKSSSSSGSLSQN